MRFVLLILVGMFLIVAVCGGVGVAIYEANQPKAVESVKVEHQTVRRELLVFGGPWCQPCREMEAIVNRARNRPDVRVVHVDPQEDNGSGVTVEDYSVENCPAFIVLDGPDGKVLGHFEGKMTSAELDRFIETGQVPHREPAQVLDSPNRDEPQPERPHPIRSIVTGNTSDGRHAEHERSPQPRHEAEPPKKNASNAKPHSCPCTFGRPNPWSVR